MLFVRPTLTCQTASSTQRGTPVGSAQAESSIGRQQHQSAYSMWSCKTRFVIISTSVACMGSAACFPCESSSVFVYLTVLSPGGMMTQWLVFVETPDYVIGIFRAISALSGLTATFIIQRAMKRFGAPRSGVAAAIFQMLMLVPAALCFMFSAPVPVFLAFLVLSRVGLWSYDVCQVQVMQEGVAGSDVSTVNAIERSVQKLAEMTMYVLAMIWHDPTQFWVLVTVSCVAVATSGVLFAVWTFALSTKHGTAVVESDAGGEPDEQQGLLQEDALLEQQDDLSLSVDEQK
eukprot:TRINITY_DN9372_c0_g1_i1.p1 TRINITY_DN9372_c0_g1~~TRINITY_DN9372_c0_g1_i1.p1  ORF type:complete len:289 (-),score=55.38 TRINITY_DN9372_c0_g1_i1:151-1017(-)